MGFGNSNRDRGRKWYDQLKTKGEVSSRQYEERHRKRKCVPTGNKKKKIKKVSNPYRVQINI